jgi:hypothetical protein
MTMEFDCGCSATRDRETGEWKVTAFCDMHSEQFGMDGDPED